MTKLIGGNISDTPIKNIGDGSAFSAGGGSCWGGYFPESFTGITKTNSNFAASGGQTILDASSNTDGILLLAFSWYHSTDNSDHIVQWGINDGVPTSAADFLHYLGHNRPSTWSVQARIASGGGPIWIPAGYGLYAYTDNANVQWFWNTAYISGPNPDENKYLSWSTDGTWESGYAPSGFFPANVADNQNGVIVQSWSVGYAGPGIDASLSLFDSAGNGFGLFNARQGDDAAWKALTPGIIYMPPGMRANIAGIGGSGTQGHYSIKIL